MVSRDRILSLSKSKSLYNWRSVTDFVVAPSPLWDSWPYFTSVDSDREGRIRCRAPSLRKDGSVIHQSPCRQLSLQNTYTYIHTHTHTRGCIQKFPDWVITKYTLTTINTRWEATQRVMATKVTRLTHKIGIQLHLVADSCTICNSRSRRPVPKLSDTPSCVCVCVCVCV
jgi:hypothetical protein